MSKELHLVLKGKETSSIFSISQQLLLEGKNTIIASLPPLVRSFKDFFVTGPTVKSWSLPYHVLVNTIRDSLANLMLLQDINLEGYQYRTSLPAIIPKDGKIERESFIVDKNVISHIKTNAPGVSYSKHADDANHIVEGEWVSAPGSYDSDYIIGGAYVVGSAQMYRKFAYNYSRDGDCRVYSINYRLAPQFEYPCGLIDAVSGYLHLLKSYPASKICIIGDSAGAGLLISLLLVLKDMKFQMPAGGICLSPWVDLTHSSPSFLDNEGFDYLPALHDPRLGDRLHYYCGNGSLTLPYVSPIFARDFGGLPPLLIQTGHIEKLYDEIQEIANVIANSPINPPNVTLEVYQDHVHVFQVMMFCQASKVAFARLGAFVKQVTNRDFSKRTVSSRIDLDYDGKVKSEVLIKDTASMKNLSKVGTSVVSETSAWDLLTDSSIQSLDDQSRVDGFGFDVCQLANVSDTDKSDGSTVRSEDTIVETSESDKVLVRRSSAWDLLTDCSINDTLLIF